MMKPEPRDHLDSAIVVWMAQVSQAHDSLPFLEPFLYLNDKQRAARFRFPEDRARFVLGRGLLRQCLGRYLGQIAATIKLAYTALGRPIFPQDQTIQFSMTHTHDLVAIAVTARAQVGIDLEYMQSPADLSELAGRILSAEDFRIFQTLSSVEKIPAFYRAWTRKEAYLKARGEGISEGLQQVSVAFGPEESAFVIDTRDESAAQKWRLHPLPAPVNYLGSIACDNAQKRLDFHRVHLNKGDVILD